MAKFWQSNKKKYVSISLVCLLLGILIGLSVQVYFIFKNASTSNDKDQDLIEVIASLEDSNAELEAEIQSLRGEMNTSTNDIVNGLEYIDRLKKQVSDLLLIAEQTPVTGPGIILTIDDNKAGAQAAAASDAANYVPENFIIHDTDLRYLLNDISYMAEAISINGQRIANTSSIRCVGTVILVNSTRLSAPYEISLIGSPTMLKAAIEDSDQYQYLKTKNMPIKITQSDNINIPAYVNSQSTTYLQPYTNDQNN